MKICHRSFTARRALRLSLLKGALAAAILITIVSTEASARAEIVSMRSPLNLGVLGLSNTTIDNFKGTITGSEGIYIGGSISNNSNFTVTGNVYEYSSGELSGLGKVNGSVIIDPANLTTMVNNALSNATAAAALVPTQTFSTISSATTITGNGGVNVIKINGDITNSISLSGGAGDVFVINVTGSLRVTGMETPQPCGRRNREQRAL